MNIRLLKKSEVNAHKERERKLEIEQGLALSRRVDGLRETQVEEERSLQEFRAKTIKQIQEEIVATTTVRDTLLGEIKALRDEKAEGLKVNELRTQELDARDAELTEYYTIVTNKEIELDQLLTDATTLKRGADDDYARARTAKLTAEELVNDAVEYKRQAKVTLDEAEQVRFKGQELYNVTSQQWESRKASLAKKEQVLDEREQALNKREVELGNKERAINDKYQALLQAQSASKK